MKTLLTVLLLVGTPYLAKAQVDDSFDLDLDPVTSEELSVDSKPTDKEPSTALKSEARQNRSIYIVNQASSGSKAGAESKTEQNDTAIVGSRADDLRKNRQRAEVETELKATEKIEESRLHDERRRSDTLFGERFKDLEKSENPAPAPVLAPVYVPVPVAPPHVTHDVENNGYRESHKRPSTTKNYVIGMVGLTEFPKADNIQGNGALGIGLGVEAQERVLIEGMFQYASFKSTYPWPSDIDEYSGIGALKFQFSKGTIRPIAGALAVYSYRSYSDDFSYQSRQSHSSVLDAGVLGGAQFALADDFAIGAEFRYLWNLTSKTDGYYSAFFPNQQPLDNFSHYVFAITGRLNF
jgi:hypothetical protein